MHRSRFSSAIQSYAVSPYLVDFKVGQTFVERQALSWLTRPSTKVLNQHEVACRLINP